MRPNVSQVKRELHGNNQHEVDEARSQQFLYRFSGIEKSS